MVSKSFLLLVASASIALSSPMALEPRTDATNVKCTDANAYVLIPSPLLSVCVPNTQVIT